MRLSSYCFICAFLINSSCEHDEIIELTMGLLSRSASTLLHLKEQQRMNGAVEVMHLDFNERVSGEEGVFDQQLG